MPSPVIASALRWKLSQARNQRPQRACVRLVGVVYIGLNMLSDLIYPLVDPRARDRQ